MLYPTPIAKLIDSYSKLPGIGIKTATRLAFYTIGMSDDDVNEFAKNLLSAKRELTYCSICGRLTDDDPCSICTDPTRDQTTILVLEDSRDVAAMENIQEYHGLYHVLHGLISPMNGKAVGDLTVTGRFGEDVGELISLLDSTIKPEYSDELQLVLDSQITPPIFIECCKYLELYEQAERFKWRKFTNEVRASRQPSGSTLWPEYALRTARNPM